MLQLDSFYNSLFILICFKIKCVIWEFISVFIISIYVSIYISVYINSFYYQKYQNLYQRDEDISTVTLTAPLTLWLELEHLHPLL